MEDYELLNLSTDIGFFMLVHGAEVYRVEESIRRMLNSYGREDADVYVIPGSIVVTLCCKDGKPMTKTRRVLRHQTNLDKIDALNNLVRSICRETPDFESASLKFKEILGRKVYSNRVLLIVYAIIGASFAIFFGGTLRDAVFAMLAAMGIKIIQILFEKIDANDFFTIVICSAFASFFAIFSAYFHFADNMDKVTIGALMTLVPGITITNCMRDFIAGDLMTGLSRLAEAILTAAGIAIGVAVNLMFLKNFIV
ncbi:MAG TPA: threonine/serine exporter family protein [Oscillospiraceae bacterium]|jgi:uncharacterized membrane protein YjjP (DUF1212 family)|nr:hypothetical protein [Oscillospiraceae bacterium]MDN5378905.1 hypothetical protein [Clostridiales bacterium]HOV42028.1 threonine/serine exporter family protein [Oscillospiraceae bacterium]